MERRRLHAQCAQQSHATHTQIRVTGLASHHGGPPQAVTLTVEDNGRGFVLSDGHPPVEEGLGLANMNERATSLGGNFAIVPRPAGGTVVTVAIPLAMGVFVPWGIDLPMAAGAVAMSLSTIIVAANAQLLRRLKLRPDPVTPEPAPVPA